MNKQQTIAAEAINISLGYNPNNPILRDLSFQIQPGVTVLFGRNGAGKTTLMRTLVSVLPKLTGELTVQTKHIGYLGHRLAIAEGLTVRENLTFWRGVYESSDDNEPLGIDECVHTFSLDSIIGKKIQQLSRGQRQRVDLARLFMGQPDFIVLDEPLTGLDPVYAAEVRTLLKNWGKNRAIIYSTHSVADAIGVADHCFVIHGGKLTELNKSDVSEDTIIALLGGDDE